MTDPEPTNLANFQRRVIQDAIASGDESYWLRRAATFEWARPKAGDYHGQATREMLRALDRQNAEIAEACRARARACRARVVA